MPKSLGQEILFTILMVFVMVYAMVCYNIALAMGGLSNSVFLLAFHELPIMMPIAFLLDLIIVGPIAKKITFSKSNFMQESTLSMGLSLKNSISTFTDFPPYNTQKHHIALIRFGRYIFLLIPE